MSSLSIFPTEILEWITSVVNTPQQMRLWLCGDRILNYKLKKGGLKRTSLCWPGHTWMPWPRSYFATLDDLVDVKWGADIGTSLCPTLELNLLPKTLKRLDLVCDDVFILLRQQNVNMNDILPILQSLKLSGRLLREENLKNLPSNLIELHVESPDVAILSSNIFGDLPRHIASLTLLFVIVDESELENDLPSQLIFLFIDRLRCNFNWFSKLPKSLKTLAITFNGFDPDWHTLPPQLEELGLESSSTTFPQSALPQLPQSLTILKMVPLEGYLVADDILQRLPKNLTRLDLQYVKIEPSGLQLLPTSIADLNTIVPATHPDLISFLRPNTRSIRIGPGPFADKLNLFPFPTNLQYLSLSRINDDICAMLPPGLQRLRVEGGLITTKGASKLPKSLTDLTAFGVFDDNESMSYLRHISNLYLSFSKDVRTLNEHWISSLLPSSSLPGSNHDDLATSINVSDFNSHLTSLSIEVAGDFGTARSLPDIIFKPFFDALPKFINLKKLNISCIGGISSDWFSSIPKTVTDLTIHHLATSPTATQLTTLPQCLRYLDMHIVGGNWEWSDETLQSLPRSLQVFSLYHFQGASPNLTENMHKYLPPNLKSTSLKFKVDGSKKNFVAPWNRLYKEN